MGPLANWLIVIKKKVPSRYLCVCKKMSVFVCGLPFWLHSLLLLVSLKFYWLHKERFIVHPKRVNYVMITVFLLHLSVWLYVSFHVRHCMSQWAIYAHNSSLMYEIGVSQSVKKKKKNAREARGTFSFPVGAYANLVFMQMCQRDLYV